MNRDDIISLCGTQTAATSDQPFDEDSLVFRVGRKIFAIIDLDSKPGRVSLKCPPEMSGDLRAAFKAIIPGWHLNKEHWNTLILDSTVPDDIVSDLVARSWRLVADSLRGKAREEAGLPPLARAKKAPALQGKAPKPPHEKNHEA